MDIQAQKTEIIEKFRHINDVNLINAIKSLLDYALYKETKQYEIPKEQQKIVMERFENVRNNPDSLMDWEEAKKSLKSE